MPPLDIHQGSQCSTSDSPLLYRSTQVSNLYLTQKQKGRSTSMTIHQISEKKALIFLIHQIYISCQAGRK